MSFQGIVGEVNDHYECVQFDWVIKDFFALNNNMDNRYHSPVFDFWGENFYLELYPNGQINRKSQGWIGIYLVLRKRSVNDVQLKAMVGIKTADGYIENIGTIINTFKKQQKSWGFSHFLKRSVLKIQRGKLTPSGVLTIAVIIDTGYLQPNGKTIDTFVQTDVKEITFRDRSSQCQIPENTVSSDVSVQTAEEFEYSDVKEGHDFPAKKGFCDVSVQANAEEIGSSEVKEAYSFIEDTGGEKVLQDIIKIWRSGDICDVIIEVKGVEFKAHKIFLAARTPVLAAMFQHDTAEKKSGVIVIKDCEPTIFKIFLNYIYTGIPQELNVHKAIPLYVVAEKYLIDDLKEFCVQYIQDNLCLDIFCDAVMLAVRHGETKLLDYVTRFAAENIRQIIKTVQWQNFIEEESAIANEILIKALE